MRSICMKRSVNLLVFLILFSGFSASVHAFGISMPYNENNTILVNPGKTYSYTLTIQNGDDEPYYVDIDYSSEKNIAWLDQTKYYVESKTYNTTFTFYISAPEDAADGDTYKIEFSARPDVSGAEGVSMGVEIRRNFYVTVTSEHVDTKLYTAVKKALNSGSGWIKFIIIPISLLLLGFIVYRLWTLSKSISKGLENDEKSNYTISDAKDMKQMTSLLSKMSDDEYELSHVKHLVHSKVSELSDHKITYTTHFTRKQLIEEIKKHSK